MDSDLFLGPSFAPLKIEDQASLGPFLRGYPQPLCDYTFASLYAWGEVYRHSWAFYDDRTLLLSLYLEGKRHLLQPIGEISPECQNHLLAEGRKLSYPLCIIAADQQFIDNQASFCGHLT